jgi:hypothetical protein
MAFLGFFNVYCLRVNLSVALIAMVNNTGTEKNISDVETCAGPDTGKNTTAKSVCTFMIYKLQFTVTQ